jgi:hypothetical protein
MKCTTLLRIFCNQDGDFPSYSLLHFYEHDPSRRRKRSLPDDSEKVHYGLTFDGKDHHVELWPNHDFISPGMMIEERGVGASLGINNVKIGRANTTRFLSLYLESRATPGISASGCIKKNEKFKSITRSRVV